MGVMRAMMSLVVGCVVLVCAGCATSERSVEPAVLETEAEIERALGLDEVRPRVMLVGTFHFEDAGLDEYTPEHAIDVMSAARQAEIEEVVDRLAAFGPTVVCVERRPDRQGAMDERYRAYLAGAFELPANEVYQIGFRLAARMGLDGVHAVDAEGRWYEDRTDLGAFAAEHGQAGLLESPVMEAYMGLAAYLDEAKMRRTLRQQLLAMNAPAVLRAAHGVYLVGPFRVNAGDEYPGVDGFMTAWFNRNMRMYMNILRAIDEPEERVVVIVGQGHVPHLRHAVACSPEVELVELSAYLGE